MDEGFWEALQDCESDARQLLSLLAREREHMPRCVTGELLEECQRGTRAATRAVQGILDQIQVLRLG